MTRSKRARGRAQSGPTSSHVDWAPKQDEAYGRGYDYAAGSPHLRHPALRTKLSGLLTDEAVAVQQRGLPASVLEIGAGHGAYTEVFLDAGGSVTATEVAAASAARLQERFPGATGVRVVHDPAADLAPLGEERFGLIAYISVLHHIPDYAAAIAEATERHLLIGGSLVTAQDPLWYPQVPRMTRAIDRIAYYNWRLLRGNYLRGIATLARRLRGRYSDAEPSDVVEYHVVRQGVDERRLVRLLQPLFEEVELVTYWSTQAALWQAVGERLGLVNTFALRARRFRGPTKNDHPDSNTGPAYNMCAELARRCVLTSPTPRGGIGDAGLTS